MMSKPEDSSPHFVSLGGQFYCPTCGEPAERHEPDYDSPLLGRPICPQPPSRFRFNEAGVEEGAADSVAIASWVAAASAGCLALVLLFWALRAGASWLAEVLS
jgi:hypothetical protein